MIGRRAASAGAVLAATVAAALPLPFFSGVATAADVEAGRSRAGVCAACHGPGGNSANPAVPSLAGQPAQFIAMELYQFREGNRKDAQMTPMAANLTNAEMNDLAAYFSAQKPAPPLHKTTPENAASGPRLAEQFHCTQCHTRTLTGQQHIPRIAGQQFDYLIAQLRGFKTQKRADIDGNMTSAALELSDKDIETLADYISGLGAL